MFIGFTMFDPSSLLVDRDVAKHGEAKQQKQVYREEWEKEGCTRRKGFIATFINIHMFFASDVHVQQLIQSRRWKASSDQSSSTGWGLKQHPADVPDLRCYSLIKFGRGRINKSYGGTLG